MPIKVFPEGGKSSCFSHGGANCSLSRPFQPLGVADSPAAILTASALPGWLGDLGLSRHFGHVGALAEWFFALGRLVVTWSLISTLRCADLPHGGGRHE